MSAPARASATATDAPIPWEAPVITARLPVRSYGDLYVRLSLLSASDIWHLPSLGPHQNADNVTNNTTRSLNKASRGQAILGAPVSVYLPLGSLRNSFAKCDLQELGRSATRVNKVPIR